MDIQGREKSSGWMECMAQCSTLLANILCREMQAGARDTEADAQREAAMNTNKQCTSELSEEKKR